MRCETLVFFDLETSGLITDLSANDPRKPPRPRPGDVKRDNQAMFDCYHKVDITKETKLPKIMELSMVALPHNDFLECAFRMAANHKSYSKDYRLKAIPASVLTLQFNPGFTDKEWELYEGNKQFQFNNLKKGDVTSKLSFKQNWPVIRAFLDVLPAPIALIAHNGFAFDYRVLLAELRDNELLTSRIFQEKVVFADSLLVLKDIEKTHHETVKTVTHTMDWARCDALFASVTLPNCRHELPPDEDKQDDEQNPANALKRPRRMTIDNFLDDDFDCPLRLAALRTPEKGLSTPTKPIPLNKYICRTAPPKLNLHRGFLKKCQPASPLRFMKYQDWCPAKVQRMRDELFEKLSDGSWNFDKTNSERYFYEAGQFTLTKLYRDIFDSEYPAHHAYEDCMALLQVCLAYGLDFLRCLEISAVPLRQYDST